MQLSVPRKAAILGHTSAPRIQQRARPARWMSKASFNSNGSGFAKTDDASGNSLFTPQFMAVLQDSLDRQGTDTLWEGPPAEERDAAEVEMMEYAVAHCIDRLQMLERMQKTVEAALAAETRQLQRLKFVQDKVVGSAAYTKTLKKMLDDAEREGVDRYRSATGSMLETWDSGSDDSDHGLGVGANPYEKQSSGGQWWETGTGKDSGHYDWQNNNWQQRNDSPSSPPTSTNNGSGGAYATRRGGDSGRRRGDGGRRR